MALECLMHQDTLPFDQYQPLTYDDLVQPEKEIRYHPKEKSFDLYRKRVHAMLWYTTFDM